MRATVMEAANGPIKGWGWVWVGLWVCLALSLGGCGGGSGAQGTCSSGNTAACTSAASPAPSPRTALPSSFSLKQQCAAPRPADTIDPETNQPYGDVQGSLAVEKAWIRSYVDETYLWYPELPDTDPSPSYVLGGDVPYIYPANNARRMVTLDSNYMLVDAYFDSQRTTQFTASGKPKDQFHFTYLTSDWEALASAGNVAGFGFQVALLASEPPRQAVVAYVDPTTAAAQNNLARGAQFLTVNGVDVANGDDVATINEGLFSPVPGKEYQFVVLDQGATTQRTITMTAGNVALTPVQNVGVIPTSSGNVGYMLFNDHIATAESELIDAVNQLKAANVSDVVLDLRYNGGGYLDIASELAYMLADPAAIKDKFFEQESFNDKNPFGLTAAQTITPFADTTLGFSTTAGQPLPQLGLKRVFVITSHSTCSASEAVMNGLLGAGISVIQIGSTTCGKPYGFLPQDNCSTTYFTIQFKGVNQLGFGDYADGFVPAGGGSTPNNLPGCVVADDFSRQLGDPAEARLAAALQYRASGKCPVAVSQKIAGQVAPAAEPLLIRSPLRENRFFKPGMRH